MTREQQRCVGGVARDRADLIEAGAVGHQAVAADAAVGGLEADHAAEGGRLADRAARVAAEGRGARRAATAAAEPPEEPPGTRSRSHGLRVWPVALFSVDEPMANSSMLVLPRMTAPASWSLRTAVAV